MFSLATKQAIAGIYPKERCTSLAMSSQGLVLSMFKGEVLLLDPIELTTTRKIAVPNLMRVTAAPKSKFAVATSGSGEYSICVIDLEKGAIVQKLANRTAMYITMSPDGKTVYSIGSDLLLAMALSDTGELWEEQTSAQIIRAPQGICLSPAGDFVCVPCYQGNVNAPDHPKVGEHATYVFGKDNLRKPLFVLDAGQYPRAIGFDPVSGCVITRSPEHQVKLYSFKGELLAQQETSLPRSLPEQFVVSPQGHDVLAVYSLFVQYLRLPEREKK
jgi:hypothetical protein